MTTIPGTTEAEKQAKSPTKRAADNYERTRNGLDAWHAIFLGITLDEPIPETVEEYLLRVAMAILRRSKRLRSPLKLQNKKGAAADAEVVKLLGLRPRGRSAIRLDPEHRKQKAARTRVTELIKSGISQIAARKQVKAAMYPNITDTRFRGILNQKD